MSTWTPSRAQFYALGLPPEACTALARVVQDIDVVSSTFALAGHGFVDGDLCRFSVAGDGAALPSPLSRAVLYAPLGLGNDLFKLVLGGAPVVLADAGLGIVQVTADYSIRLDVILDSAARWVDSHCVPYGQIVTPSGAMIRAACDLAARDVATTIRASSPSYSIEDIRAKAEAAQAWLDKMREGMPLADPPADSTPASAELGARAFARRPSRGWKASTV